MNAIDTQVSFDDPELPARLDAMTDEQLHRLPFGVIGLDQEGKVRFYSDTEARQSGAAPRTFGGMHFFETVAPCMNNEEVRGRIEHALSEGNLDLEIGHTGDFSDPHRFLRIRAMSCQKGGLWLAHQR